MDDQLKPSAHTDCIKSLMKQHVHIFEEVLKEASALATVFIVTLARRDWVERSISFFMPSLTGLLETCKVQVIYASEYAETQLDKQMHANDTGGAQVAEHDAFVNVKAEAIFCALEHASRANGGKVSHLISIGDSDIERHGAVDACKRYAQTEKVDHCNDQGDSHLCTCQDRPALIIQTLKLLEEPTIEELRAELTMVKRWLPYLVVEKDDIDAEIDTTEEDDTLMELHKMITGQEEDLSWRILAGVSDDAIVGPAF